MNQNLLRAIAVFAFAAVGEGSFAATYSYSFDTEFSKGTPPAGTSPWATLSFSDISGGGVQMNLSLSNITASEKVTDFYFNFGPNPGNAALAARLASLTFTLVTGTTATGIGASLNNYKADGDGKFDINFAFPKSGNVFGAGEQSTYKVTGGSVTAADFNYGSLCTSGCGTGGWTAALHVQATGTSADKSGWIGAGSVTPPVPEPENYVLMLAGLGVVGFIARRRMQRF